MKISTMVVRVLATLVISIGATANAAERNDPLCSACFQEDHDCPSQEMQSAVGRGLEGPCNDTNPGCWDEGFGSCQGVVIVCNPPS